jgi:hypothetical protein
LEISWSAERERRVQESSPEQLAEWRRADAQDWAAFEQELRILADILSLLLQLQALTPCMPYTDLRPRHGRLWLSSCGSNCPLGTVVDRC